MRRLKLVAACVCLAAGLFGGQPVAQAQELKPLEYNNPGLVVDLGVGLWAWPLPMDFDGDGDYDLVVSAPDKPYNGTYFFENVEGDVKQPVFRPGVKIGPGHQNIQVSHVDGEPRVMIPGKEFRDFRKRRFDKPQNLPADPKVHETAGRNRANQWKYADFDGDGALDIIAGVDDWADYGWDDAFDSKGEWTRGPLHGFVYLLRNTGSNDKPEYAKPMKVEAGGAAIDVYGWPTPNFADFDNDGDLDILCGEFLDRFTYFANVGTRTEPKYAAGQFLMHQSEPLRMDLEMIVPSAIDWDKDGDVDLVVGDEDGRVALVENTGKGGRDVQPQFLPPVYFRQQAAGMKFGALATPVGFDWDGDGDEDIVCGNTAGYIGFIENLGGGATPKFAAPVLLEAGDETIRIQAGKGGSIQGPCEAKWGYTSLDVADWNHDSLPDLVVNSIWGAVIWYENIGTRTAPKLAAARNVDVDWPAEPPKPAWVWWQPEGKQLVTQWRTTPVVVDWNTDGLNDLVMLDHEGYLALFERKRVGEDLRLLPGRRVFVDKAGKPLQLNDGWAGKSGRRKLSLIDWDGDGRRDFLANSINADWLRNVETGDGTFVLENMGPLGTTNISGHTTSPTTVDWDGNGIRDLLVGAEDGRLYYLRNPRER